MFYKLVTWFKGARRAIDEHDGRDSVKVGMLFTDLTEDEKAARAVIAVKASAAKDYLTKRDRLALTCPDFNYVPAVATDIRVTMRNYINETMPEVASTYKFLFDDK